MLTGNDEAEGMKVTVGTMRIGGSLKNKHQGKDEVLGIDCGNSNSMIKVFKRHGYRSKGKFCLVPWSEFYVCDRIKTDSIALIIVYINSLLKLGKFSN